MKSITILFTAVAILGINLLQAQNYVPVDDGTGVKFKIKNFGITVGGSFTGLKGKIEFDAAKPGNSMFDVSVESKTVNTGIGSRDKHLRKEDYFDVEKFPSISIRSTKITPATKEGWLYFFGTVTMKGVTKEISFPFRVNEENGGYRFNGEFKLNRRDYSVGGNSISLSDNLTVSLDVFAKKS
ncbi:MAG: YceI family protein [Sphingobacteriales bacterium]|nr:YceI family protein [Sphingobacteriales bacterium]